MATFRDDGLEINVKPDISGFSTPTGDRFTIFGVNSVSPTGRYYATETGQQLWMVDASGNKHEISNDWLESKVAETSAKLDYIYPAVTAFMSAGLLFLNSAVVQTISSDLNIIGNMSMSGQNVFEEGTLSVNCPSFFSADVSAYNNMKVFGELDFNQLGTPDTLEKVTPFFIRSSANRLQPDGWSDPALLVLGNTKIYNMFKPEDRGLRFTVLNRESLQVIHDEVYDTAGSQFRVTDLTWKMFELMNNTKNVGILNSREDWESLIWRKDTAESAGMSASDISAAYSNLTVGCLLDQFNRFGLLKAIRAAGKHSEMTPDQAGSQYCAIFEGSNIYVDTSGSSAMIYPTNRVAESWIPRTDARLPVDGEQQRAQLVGWFMKPRQLAVESNIADRSASFVTLPYGRETDAVREVNFVNISGGAGEYNVRIDNYTADILTFSFNTTAGMADYTDHKIQNVGLARFENDGDAVNVAFSKFITPIGAVIDFAGNSAPSNWLMCDGSAATISGFSGLFNIVGFNFGMMSLITISGSPTIVTGSTYVSVSGVPMLLTNAPIDVSGTMQLMTGVIQSVSGGYKFISGVVNSISGVPTFYTGSSSDVTGNIYHFLVPNCHGKVSLGAGTATILDISGNSVSYTYPVGEISGSNRHILSVAELAAHTHTVGAGSLDAASTKASDGSSFNYNITSGVAGLNRAHNNMMPYISLNKIIRYK